MTPRPPGSLVRHIKQSRCVVFVGAGLSASAGLPTWKNLLLMGIEELVSSMPEGEAYQDELKKLVDGGKLLEVADFCKEKLGAAYHQFLTDKLRGDTAPLPATHDVLMHLPFNAWVTTNYDKLLERAYSKVKGGFPKTLTHKDTDTLGRLLFDGGPFILKAHGDIDRPETVVLTSREYSEIIHANPAFNEVFTSLLLTKALLFVGYSLSDPDFRLLMDRQLTHFKSFVPERYALMTGLGPVERDVLWRTARIQVISYENVSKKHAEVLQFLQALKEAVLPTPAPAGLIASDVNAGDSVDDDVPKTHVKAVSYAMSTPGGGAPPAPAAVGRAPAPTAVPGAARPAHEEVEGPRTEGSFLSRFLTPLGVGASPVPAASVSSRPPAASPSPPPAPAAPQAAPSPAVAQPESVRMPGETEEELPDESGAPLQLSISMSPRGLQFQLTQGQERLLAQGTAPGVRNELVQRLREAEARKSLLKASFCIQQVLGARLPPELAPALRRSGPLPPAPLQLQMPPALARFPWELLPVEGLPLALSRALVRVPVGISAQARGAPHVRASPRVVLVQGREVSGEAAQRLQRLAQLYAEARGVSMHVAMGAEATSEQVMALLEDPPDLFYFVGSGGPGDLEDGELSLALHGDTYLSTGVLRSFLDQRPVPFLVLDVPESAFAPYALLSSFKSPSSREFLFKGRQAWLEVATQTGVGAFLGGFATPSAPAGTAFMVALHRELLAGLPIAEAVRRARVETHKAFPEDPAPLQYVLSGDGDLRLR